MWTRLTQLFVMRGMRCRKQDWEELRARHPVFTYDSFSVERDAGGGWVVRFVFEMESGPTFRPFLLFPAGAGAVDEELLQVCAFHLGLVELVSYWKAACSPRVRVRCGTLDGEQQRWWRWLYYHGLGEFRYLNGLEVSEEELLTWECDGPHWKTGECRVERAAMVPVGGGKDSLVTLDLLERYRGAGVRLHPLVLNPTRAQWESTRLMGYEEASVCVVERQMDRQLFDLNARGYLNGHTPFSALLGFVSATAGVLFSAPYLLLSNERSASESTVAGSQVNHQWSKGEEFEAALRAYLQRYLAPQLVYVSVLRPWSELQIAQHFASIPGAIEVFRSCNVGQKQEIWCGRCAKCLFVEVMLAPFVSRAAMRRLFNGTTPLEQEELGVLLDSLAGATAVKPFECVGTVEEVRVALGLIAKRHAGDLPALVVSRLRLAEDRADCLLSNLSSPERAWELVAERLQAIARGIEWRHF